MRVSPKDLRFATDGGGYERVAQRWTLRLIASLLAKGYNADRLSDEVACGLGLRSHDATVTDISPATAICRRLDELESQGTSRCTGGVFENAQAFASHVGLTAAEHDVLLFAVLLQREGYLEAICDLALKTSTASFTRMLAAALERPPAEVAAALRPEGRLRSTGLLRWKNGDFGFDYRMEILPGVVEALFAATSRSPEDWIGYFAAPAPCSSLRIPDFAHVGAEVEVIRDYLAAALKRGMSGSNVLLWGPAGTGKTELARVVAKALGVRLWGVIARDKERKPVAPASRMDSYLFLGQLLVGRSDAIVLYDEFESALTARRSVWEDDSRFDCKAWMVDRLENNRVPTIWITNSLHGIEQAILRRFDIVVELRSPPQSVRRRIVAAELDGAGIGDRHLEAIAAQDKLSPGVVNRLAKVVRIVGGVEATARERTLDTLLRHRLSAMGCPQARETAAAGIAYRMDCINATPPLSVLELAVGLRDSGRGSILLHGEPGTGKTAFVRHLVDRLDRPLLLKRYSDIASMWVGEAEKNIARLFEEAADEGAVLFLDEADSFLQERRNARQSWEITEVNELLTRMETFPGIFFCATNFLEHLDSAALRRFALKVRFDPLREAQRLQLFGDLLEALQRPKPERPAWERIAASLRQLDRLTPGDFAAVRNRYRLLAAPTDPGELVMALAAECALKSGGHGRQVGFVR